VSIFLSHLHPNSTPYHNRLVVSLLLWPASSWKATRPFNVTQTMPPSKSSPNLERYHHFCPSPVTTVSFHVGKCPCQLTMVLDPVLESDVCARHDIDAAVVSKLLANGPRTPFRSCCASSPACLGVSKFQMSHALGFVSLLLHGLPLPRHDRISVSHQKHCHIRSPWLHRHAGIHLRGLWIRTPASRLPSIIDH